MRASLLLLVLSLSSTLQAQTKEPRSVAAEALHMASSLTEREMSDCAKAHPHQSQRFMESAAQSRTKLQAALEGLRSKRPQDLDLTVPAVLVVGREMMAALMATDTSRLTLEICNRTAGEIARVTDQEASELMNQLVSTLLSGIAAHQHGMARALR